MAIRKDYASGDDSHAPAAPTQGQARERLTRQSTMDAQDDTADGGNREEKTLRHEWGSSSRDGQS